MYKFSTSHVLSLVLAVFFLIPTLHGQNAAAPKTLVANSSKPAVVTDLDRMRACYQPWLDGVDLVLKHLKGNTPQGRDAIFYGQVLRNTVFGKLIDVQGQLAHIWVTPPADPKKPTIGIFPICSDSDLPAVWHNKVTDGQFIGRYQMFTDKNDGIILRNRFQAPQLLRGLVMLHEMQHGTQWRAANGSAGTSREQHMMREVDAYNFEFAIFDQLDLPGYKSLVADEVSRIKLALAIGRSALRTNELDPRLSQIFTDLGMRTEPRQLAASELFLRAVFKVFESNGSKDQVFAQKAKYLAENVYK